MNYFLKLSFYKFKLKNNSIENNNWFTNQVKFVSVEAKINLFVFFKHFLVGKESFGK
jgi:hypothetical protein